MARPSSLRKAEDARKFWINLSLLIGVALPAIYATWFLRERCPVIAKGTIAAPFQCDTAPRSDSQARRVVRPAGCLR